MSIPPNTDDDGNMLLYPISDRPFDGWGNWQSIDDDGKATIVMFQTMKHALYYAWEERCVSHPHPYCDHPDTPQGNLMCMDSERVVRIKHDLSDIVPGIEVPLVKRDGTKEYNVIVPGNDLNMGICRKWLDIIEDKYGLEAKLCMRVGEGEYDCR